MKNFRITALDKSLFQPLFDLDSEALKAQGMKKMKVDAKPGFPCRVSLQDAEIGEEVLLLPFKYHSVNSPYQAEGPIFIRKNAQTAQLNHNEIPLMLQHRLLSLRAYNSEAMMIYATASEGIDLQAVIANIFENPLVEYIHIHNAKPGCYNCKVERVIAS